MDSYNSADTTNYPGGLYSSAPRNVATGVGTNATVYINAPISTLGGSIYGNVETNNGTLTKTANLYGTVSNNVVRPIIPVTTPSWAVTASSPAPSSLTVGTNSTPYYASYTSANGLTVNLPAGQTAVVVNLYITGDVTNSITVASGVTLKLYFAGNFSMKARDITNYNNKPANLQFYGINPLSGSRSFDIGSGNPGYRYFSLNAPAYDFSVNGNPDFVGSWIVKTVSGNGNTSWHYDEALGTAGDAVGYTKASWVEDER